MFPSQGLYRLQGIDDRRSLSTSTVLSIEQEWVPATFNMSLWNLQAERYYEYWRWFTGDILRETRAGSNKDNQVLKYPLEINPVRDFSRKHAALLVGEDTFDSAKPLVRSVFRPRPTFDMSNMNEDTSADVDNKTRRVAQICQNALDMVWTESGGASLQQENATLSQFLGGSVFEAKWNPDLKDRLIPIEINNVMPDFFLPIYEGNNYWNLLECFIVYRISAYVAKQMYGYKGSEATWVIYCEHWTRNDYSVYINNEPVETDGITYKNVKNPFGFVPMVYIPHLREGNFYGSSMVEDIRGLTREFNARMADTGDAVRNSVHRRRYARDLRQDPKPKQIDATTWATNLGVTDPSTKVSPDVWVEDPPVLPDSLANYANDHVWKQLIRMGAMSDMSYGEDEGSQRSALTLAFRMWPSTSHARAERVFWRDGLNYLAKRVLQMMVVKKDALKGVIEIPADFQKYLEVAQDFQPMIPRDREQQVDEVITRVQANLLTPEAGMKILGDIPYVTEEIAKLREWLTFLSTLETKPLNVKPVGAPLAASGSGKD